VLDALASMDALPLVRGDALETRAHYRKLVMARRGNDYRPESVASVEDRDVDGPGGPLPVRIYTPSHDRGRVVTFLHGGGWVVGDLDTHDPLCRRVANALGAVVVAVDYRLAPEHPFPAPLDDTLAALAWTAESFPGRTHIVAGDSAGAGLAAGAALRIRDSGGPALAAQLLIYPPADPTMSEPSIKLNGDGYFLTESDMVWFYEQYLPAEHRADPAVDLLRAPNLQDLPPAVITTAEFDPLRDEGDRYARRLRAAGVRVEHFPAAGLIHGYFAFFGVVDAAERLVAEVFAGVEAVLA
jgi:acetyl esterase